jgi:chromosome segregation ATPase
MQSTLIGYVQPTFSISQSGWKSRKINAMLGVVLLDNATIDQRVTKLETTVDEHTRQLNAQSEKNDTLTRLATLLEREMSDSKERERRQELRDEAQSKQMEKFGDTLVQMNQNLTLLNNSQIQLGQRVDNIESTLQNQNINTNSLFKGILKEVGLLLGGFVLAFLLYKFGISGGVQK